MTEKILINLLKPACPRGARLIPLTQGKYAVVDVEDYAHLRGYSWCLFRLRKKVCGVQGWVGGRVQLLHRLIMNVEDGVLVDHVDHDTLNNRRSNLRRATPQQNGANMRRRPSNRSGFKGVVWDAARRKWAAFIKVNYRSIGLGRYDAPEDAAAAYDAAAVKYSGDRACTNGGGA